MKHGLEKLSHIADLVIKRVISEVEDKEHLAEALERAYPFGDLPFAREVWDEAIARHTGRPIRPSTELESIQHVYDFWRWSQRPH